MIATVTLNPAVDKTYTCTGILPGQVNRMDSAKNLAGGKGINVAKVLRQYGYPVRTLGFLGGYSGKLIEDYVISIGAESLFTKVAGETRCSVNILSQDGYVTELLEPGPGILGEEFHRFLRDFEEGISDCELVALCGSVPESVPGGIYSDLIRWAKVKGKKVLLDTSGTFLKESVREAPFMAKPNLRELEFLTGRRLRDLDEVIEAALLVWEWGVPHVLVSMGEKGILYVREGEILRVRAPKVRAFNTVGCGDSVVAAFAMGFLQEMDAGALLRYCAGISAANAATLENGVIPTELAEKLSKEAQVEYLSHRAD